MFTPHHYLRASFPLGDIPFYQILDPPSITILFPSSQTREAMANPARIWQGAEYMGIGNECGSTTKLQTGSYYFTRWYNGWMLGYSHKLISNNITPGLMLIESSALRWNSFPRLVDSGDLVSISEFNFSKTLLAFAIDARHGTMCRDMLNNFHQNKCICWLGEPNQLGTISTLLITSHAAFLLQRVHLQTQEFQSSLIDSVHGCSTSVEPLYLAVTH